MTRSWTDPRTGKRWQIDVVRSAQKARRQQRPGRGEGEASSALLFESSGTSYAFQTDEAARLEALEDERLAEFLDAAREGSSPDADLRDAEGAVKTRGAGRVRGGGEASPSAAGRESQPHDDPATE
jgi:hypothetical protein